MLYLNMRIDRKELGNDYLKAIDYYRKSLEVREKLEEEKD